MQGMVTLNSKEQKRERIISQVGRGVTGREAASVLGLSLRQVRRLVSGYRGQGSSCPGTRQPGPEAG